MRAHKLKHKLGVSNSSSLDIQSNDYLDNDTEGCSTSKDSIHANLATDLQNAFLSASFNSVYPDQQSIGSESFSNDNVSSKLLFKNNTHSSEILNLQSKLLKDDVVPPGYVKFKFNEDCNFHNCGYRNHQSHFHCCRLDCYYSFCDKTRFMQHTARHERLDKLMGEDFKQYRANMNCGIDSCEYRNRATSNKKSSHFHCCKCAFACSDTNKVVVHRRQHNNKDYILSTGFRKVTNTEICKELDQMGEECSLSLKQTHYHCLICNKVVLSKSQLALHQHSN